MLVNKILKIVLLLLGLSYIILQVFSLTFEAGFVGALAMILLTLLYRGWTKHKSKFFFLFLLLFTSGQIVVFTGLLFPIIDFNQIDFWYYASNLLFMSAYSVLIIKICSGLNIKRMFKELTIPIIVLVILDVFCVSLISDTTRAVLTTPEYVLEYIYNAIVMVLLSFALINYMYRNNNKSMLFLIGSIFMVFSEIIQLAYYYILPDVNLKIVYSLLLVITFIFFYLQSQEKVTEPIAAYSDDPLEV